MQHNMTEETSTEKKLLKMSPAEAATVVLDDILSNPEKEEAARKAIKDADAEIKEAYCGAFLIGNIVCNAVYGTVMEPLTKMAISYQTQLYVPLGIVPTCGEIMSHECPEDAEVDPGELLVELGELVMRVVFEGNYTLQTARENADAARTKASGSGEIVSVSTPARGVTPAGSISTEKHYSGESQSQPSQPSAAADETPSAQGPYTTRSPREVIDIASSATREIETPAPSISLEKRVTPRQGMQ